MGLEHAILSERPITQFAITKINYKLRCKANYRYTGTRSYRDKIYCSQLWETGLLIGLLEILIISFSKRKRGMSCFFYPRAHGKYKKFVLSTMGWNESIFEPQITRPCQNTWYTCRFCQNELRRNSAPIRIYWTSYLFFRIIILTKVPAVYFPSIRTCILHLTMNRIF